MIFYFTGTGNSLYVAKKIGGKFVSIAQAVRQDRQLYKDDVIGFVFPTYAVGIPRIVQRFVMNNRFEANYSFAVMTCGGSLGSSLMKFEKIMATRGLKLNYTNKMVMIDNYGMKSMGAKIRNHVQEKEDAEIGRIVADIQSRKQLLLHSSSVIRCYTNLMNICSGFCYDTADRRFTVQTNQCIQCGLCQSTCPVQNIQLNPYPHFLHKCEGCYACFNVCPKKALSPNRHPVEVQYLHPDIQQSEIIFENKIKEESYGK